MNTSDVKMIERNGAQVLLYSHDDGFTRHVVEISPEGRYRCLLNESPCFRRGTHDRMARLHGLELANMTSERLGAV